MKKSPARSQIPSQKNTLLNYFSKTPTQQKREIYKNENDEESKLEIKSPENKAPKETPNKIITPSKRTVEEISKNENSYDDDDDSEDEIIPKFNKRNKRFKRIIKEDSDSDYENSKSQSEYDSESESEADSEPESETEPESNSKLASDIKKILKNDLNVKMVENDDINFNFVQVKTSTNNGNSDDPSSTFAVLADKKKIKALSNVPSKNVEKPLASEHASNLKWPHLKYEFLYPENIKDLQGRKMLINGELNPEYDPSTLYVPKSFLDQQTPAIRQWWELKSQHFDTILFFKMGKFYEFFHMDAVICTRELKILFMTGENAHAGFPEKSYKQYADALIQKGYKIARVEQTETPDMMAERCKNMTKLTKFDKVVKREVCRVSTLGTRLMSDIDADNFLDYTSYLMAFTCKEREYSLYEFGICFVDVSMGKFFISQFKDDRFHSRLRTLVSHYSPVEILVEKSNNLIKLFQAICPNARLQKVKQFWSPEKTLKYIYEKDAWSKVTDDFKQSILDSSDVIQQTPKSEFQLAVTSIGGIIEYLEKSIIVTDIITMGQFEIYHPPEYESKTKNLPNQMILDSMTMKNLEIFDSLNNNTGKTSTLFKIIDHCKTAFGKRMLRSWLCQPLCGLQNDLEMRQEAVKELAENEKVRHLLKSWNEMKKVPDLDRQLTQIHSQSLKRPESHPDSRAIMFESDTYRMRRIKTFLNVLGGLEKILNFVKFVSSSESNEIESKLIRQLIFFENDGGLFPLIEDKIKFFLNSFDAERVRKEGHFIPDKGVDEEYDQAMAKIDEIKDKLEEYRKEQESFFRHRIHYVHVNKNRFQLEIPEECLRKLSKSDEEYEMKSSRKGFKRYYTPKLIEMVEELEQAENERETILCDIFRRLLAKFDQDYSIWQQAIVCMAQFDALVSLGTTKKLFESNGSVSCMPQILWNEDKPVLRAKDLRNAFLVMNNSVIPNDIRLNNETLILTGPNMGGKTTLMRSVGLMAILAQIGAYVPASECQMTPVDRIFTRIGAYDLILENESSFMVELNEALAIIKYATPLSLALIDELGSGTSTFDGTAIASSIISHLTDKIQCRVIFSTHYHSILGELKDKANIKLGFMSYMIENQNDQDPTDENIIFLYKLQSGICNKSYGFNVAKLAGIPTTVIQQAYKYSKRFKLECQINSLLNWFKVRKQPGSGIKRDEETYSKAKELLDSIRNLNKMKENNP